MKSKHLHASARGDSYVIREIDSNDNWDIGEDGLRNIRVTVHVAQGKQERDYSNQVVLADDGTVCVLVEHYSDGCTFGSSEHVEVKGIFTDEADARLFAGSLNKDHGYFGWHIAFLYFTEKV